MKAASSRRSTDAPMPNFGVTTVNGCLAVMTEKEGLK
jgi:hypothetical protein